MSDEAGVKKKRSLTELSLKWLADRVRRSERIKAAVQSGAYRVDTEKVAASLLNAQGCEESEHH